MVGIEEEVQLILVTTIGGEYRTVEVRDTLVTEIASGIGIIEVKAYVEALAGIHGKLSVDMVLTVELVTTVVIEYAGIGRQGVHEQELVDLFRGKAIGLGEDKVVEFRTVDEDTAHAGCIVAARGVVLAIVARVQRGVRHPPGHLEGRQGKHGPQGGRGRAYHRT